MKVKNIAIRVDENFFIKWKKYLKDNGKNQSVLIRALIEKEMGE